MILRPDARDNTGTPEVLIVNEHDAPVLLVADVPGFDALAFARQLCAMWNLTTTPYPVCVEVRGGVAEVVPQTHPAHLPAGIVRVTIIDHDDTPAPVVLGGEG